MWHFSECDISVTSIFEGYATLQRTSPQRNPSQRTTLSDATSQRYDSSAMRHLSDATLQRMRHLSATYLSEYISAIVSLRPEGQSQRKQLQRKNIFSKNNYGEVSVWLLRSIKNRRAKLSILNEKKTLLNLELIVWPKWYFFNQDDIQRLTKTNIKFSPIVMTWPWVLDSATLQFQNFQMW